MVGKFVQPLIFVTYKKEISLETTNTTTLAFSQSGDFLAVASGKRATIWSATTGQDIHIINGNSTVLSLFWEMDGALYCGFKDGMCVAVHMDGHKEQLRSHGFEALDQPIHHLKIHEDGLLMALGGIHKVSIFERKDHAETTEWVHKQDLAHPAGGINEALPVQVTSLHWLNSSGDLAASHLNHGVVIWNSHDWHPRSALSVPGGKIPYGDVSDDGQNFVNPNSESESIDLWKIGTSIHLRNFYDEDDAGDKGPVMFIHGDTLILGGGNKKATIWRIANGGKMQYLEHDKKITGLAANYDHENDRLQIATASTTRVILWKGYEDMSTMENIQDISAITNLMLAYPACTLILSIIGVILSVFSAVFFGMHISTNT